MLTWPKTAVFILAGGIALALHLPATAQRSRGTGNYSLIEKGLYVGGLTSAPPSGTRAVLNLCEIRDEYACDYHVWAAIPDRAPAPQMEWLLEQVKFVARQRSAGRTTFVHCQAGISRGPMVVVAYLMFKNDWTRDEALEFVQQRRPQAQPNPAFMRLLAEWEQVLRRAAPRRRNS